MRERTVRGVMAGAVAGLTLAVSVSLAGQAPKSAGDWTVPRMPDGKPDMQGVWANNNMTPLERPKVFGLRTTMTDTEYANLLKNAKAMMDGGDAFFADELFIAAIEGKTKFSSSDTQVGNYDQTWLSERVFDKRTSLIIDPPDGRMPAQLPAAIERARVEAAARAKRGPADRAQDLSLGTRCVSFGTPNLRAGYQSYFDITQGPNVVALRSEMIHDARVFPIGAGPHVSKVISQYHGDSRAHWDGDTLVVDTTNFVKDATRFTNTEQLRVTEKFKRVADDTVEYYVTVDDPGTWSRPWTLMIPLKKTGEAFFEFACHEGNYGLPAILSGARADERGGTR
jgi:hypothetical protein